MTTDSKSAIFENASVLQACFRSSWDLPPISVGYGDGQFKSAGNKTMSFDLCSAAPLSVEQVSCYLSPVSDPTLIVRCVV